ncbi:PREDICTED: ras-related protein Rab-39A-like, partial [Chlamydotis macqueenii]
KDGIIVGVFSVDQLEAAAHPSSVAGGPAYCSLKEEELHSHEIYKFTSCCMKSRLLSALHIFCWPPHTLIIKLFGEDTHSTLIWPVKPIQLYVFRAKPLKRPLYHGLCKHVKDRSITRSYYRNSVGGLLVFDITNRRSFEHVKDWLEEAKMHVQPFQIVFLLVGHKCDLVSQREVTREEAEKLSSDCGMKYIETSAKDATNVEESFTILTRDIYELVKKGEISIQDGWEGVKSGFVPNVVHSSEEAVKPRRQCVC